MTPVESPGHVYESACLNQITAPAQESYLSVCAHPCVNSCASLLYVSVHTALPWGHPGGVWMKIGEVPPSPR